jgi:hypothetical protein
MAVVRNYSAKLLFHSSQTDQVLSSDHWILYCYKVVVLKKTCKLLSLFLCICHFPPPVPTPAPPPPSSCCRSWRLNSYLTM